MKKNLNDHHKQIYKLVISLILAIFLSVTFLQPATGKEVVVTFGETKTENYFPDGIRFSVKIDIDDHRGVVTFHYRLGGNSWSYDSAKCSAKINDDNKVEYYSCVYYLDTTGKPPQLPISYKWQLYGSVDRTSEEKSVIYEDPSFDWQSLTSKNLTIWWHDRPQEFADQTLAIAAEAIKSQKSLFGVELNTSIQIVIENKSDEFLVWHNFSDDALDGRTIPAYGVMVLIVETNVTNDWAESWLKNLVPRGVSHLYFYQVVAHKQKPPLWLKQGLAGYNALNDHSSDWAVVRNAIQQGTIIPLSELRNEFTRDDQKIQLAFAESTTAAIYMFETYGQEGLNKLFSAYQINKNSDEAFIEAFDRTVSEFEKDWEAWVVQRANRSINTTKYISYFFTAASVACSCLLMLIFVVIFLILVFNNKSSPQPVE